MKINQIKIRSNNPNSKTNIVFTKYMDNSYRSNNNVKFSNFYSDERNDRIIFNKKKEYFLNNYHIVDKNNISSIHNYIFKLNFPQIKNNNCNLTNNKEFDEERFILKRYKVLTKLKNKNEKFIEIAEKKNKKNLSAKEIFNSRINYFYKMSHNIDNDINKKRKKIKITKNKKEIKKNGSSILLNNSKGISLSMNGNSFDKENKNIIKKTFDIENIKKKIKFFEKQYLNESSLLFENEKIRKAFKNSFQKIKLIKIKALMTNNFKDSN